jgi:hypothetical protein
MQRHQQQQTRQGTSKERQGIAFGSGLTAHTVTPFWTQLMHTHMVHTVLRSQQSFGVCFCSCLQCSRCSEVQFDVGLLWQRCCLVAWYALAACMCSVAAHRVDACCLLFVLNPQNGQSSSSGSNVRPTGENLARLAGMVMDGNSLFHFKVQLHFLLSTGRGQYVHVFVSILFTQAQCFDV